MQGKFCQCPDNKALPNIEMKQPHMKTPQKHMEAPYNVQAVSLQRHIVQGEEFCQLMQPGITVEKAVECFTLKRGTPMIPKTQYLLWKKESEDGIGYKMKRLP